MDVLPLLASHEIRLELIPLPVYLPLVLWIFLRLLDEPIKFLAITLLNDPPELSHHLFCRYPHPFDQLQRLFPQFIDFLNIFDVEIAPIDQNDLLLVGVRGEVGGVKQEVIARPVPRNLQDYRVLRILFYPILLFLQESGLQSFFFVFGKREEAKHVDVYLFVFRIPEYIDLP